MALWLQDAILGFLSMDLLGIGEVGLSATMLSIALAVSLATVLLFGRDARKEGKTVPGDPHPGAESATGADW